MQNKIIALRPAAADIWVALASGGQYLKALLQNNIIWKDSEEIWFTELKDASDGVRYVANLIVPRTYRKDVRLVLLAEEHKFWLTYY